MSNKILGILGNSSDFIKRGVEIKYSPFLEPYFRGRLQLIVKNFSSNKIKLKSGQIIGKVTFFNISDTSPIELITDIYTR